MKHLKLALLVCASAAFAAACAGTYTNSPNTNTNAAAPSNNAAATPASAPADDLAAARSTYNATCARCHGQNGEGGEVDFEDGGGKLKVPSFKVGHGLKHTDAEFARQIAKGGDGMPAFERRLTPEQIAALVRFIRQEFQAGLTGDAAPGPAH